MHLSEPVLWRGPDELQVGTRILPGLTPAEMDLVQGLTRPRTPEWIARALATGGIPAPRWEELREWLETPHPHRAPRQGVVLLLDAHPLSTLVGDVLAAHGVEVVTDSQGRTGRSTVLPATAPAIALLTDPWVTDPVRVAPLMRHDVAHLPLVVDDGVVVGPVVVPGMEPCTWCLALARADADPAWPTVATQLRLQPSPRTKEPDLTAAVAAWVVEDFLRGAPTLGWRVEDGAILPVSVSPHPRCTCGGLTPPCADGPDRVSAG